MAIEPTSVRFPERVLDMASVSHDVPGSGSCGTSRDSSITAGTLLMTLPTTVVTTVRPAMVSSPIGASTSKSRCGQADALDAPDHHEEADEQHEQIPVDLPVDLVRVDAPGDEERRCGDGRDDRRIPAEQEAGEHAGRHDQALDHHRPVHRDAGGR